MLRLAMVLVRGGRWLFALPAYLFRQVSCFPFPLNIPIVITKAITGTKLERNSGIAWNLVVADAD